MKQKSIKKLDLKKKTITQLDKQGSMAVQGGTGICATGVCYISAICYVTAACATLGCVTRGCATDFTRPISG